MDLADILIEWHHTSQMVNDGFPIHLTGEPKLIDDDRWTSSWEKEKTL